MHFDAFSKNCVIVGAQTHDNWGATREASLTGVVRELTEGTHNLYHKTLTICMCKFCAGIELYCCSVVLFEWYVECMLQWKFMAASALAAALPSGPLPMTAMRQWAAICTRSAQCRQDSA